MKPPLTPTSAVQRAPRRVPSFTMLCAANLVVLGLLCLLAEYVAERTWLTTLLAYAPPLVYTPVTGLLFILSLFQPKRAALALISAAVVLLFGLILGLPQLPRRDLPPSGAYLRLMTWNIAHGTGGAEGVANVILRARPDVVCLQEVNGIATAPDPLPGLIHALPGYRWERAGEVALGSRLPTGSVQQCPLLTNAGVYRVALAVPVVLPDRAAPVVVTTVHLATAATAESLSLRKTGIPAYLRRTTEARSQQIERLNDFQRQFKGAAIVCGDFNTPPRGILYRRLRAGRIDSWASAGRGTGWTFSSKHPLLRIDHVFTSPQVIARSCRVIDVSPAVSDHLPVVTDFVIGPD